MKRLQELTDAWLEGTLTSAESAELDEFLAADPAARREWFELCRVEGALRGLRPDARLQDRIMQSIRSEAGPLHATRPRPARYPGWHWDAFGVPGWRRVAALLVLLLAVGAGTLYVNRPAPRPVVQRPGPGGLQQLRAFFPFGRGDGRSDSILGMLTHVSGEVGVSRVQGDVPGRSGVVVWGGDTVDVAGNSRATMAYRDGTRVVLSPGTRVRFEQRKKQDGDVRIHTVHLEGGTLAAHVVSLGDGHRFVVQTPSATATVMGTRFTVENSDAGTRLDVIEGVVRFRRLRDGSTADIRGGEYAVTGSGTLVTPVPALPRIRQGLVTLYTFHEGGGDTVHDVSEASVPLDLKITQPHKTLWLPGGGLRLQEQGASASTRGPATRLSAACRQSNALTLEAWIVPTVVDQVGPARIVTLSEGSSSRNVTLGQDGHVGQRPSHGTFYSIRLRTSGTDSNGLPPLESPMGTVAADLTHVTYVRTADGACRFYLDGVPVTENRRDGDLSAWDDHFRLTLGDETSRDRPWIGSYHLVAIYGRALSDDEVRTNYRAGPRMR